MDELRYVGYFPVAESEDGKNIKESKAKLRTDQIPLRRIVNTPASQPESIREFISHLRFDDPTPFLSAVEEPSSARALSSRKELVGFGKNVEICSIACAMSCDKAEWP